MTNRSASKQHGYAGVSGRRQKSKMYKRRNKAKAKTRKQAILDARASK